MSEWMAVFGVLSLTALACVAWGVAEEVRGRLERRRGGVVVEDVEAYQARIVQLRMEKLALEAELASERQARREIEERTPDEETIVRLRDWLRTHKEGSPR